MDCHLSANRIKCASLQITQIYNPNPNLFYLQGGTFSVKLSVNLVRHPLQNLATPTDINKSQTV